MGPTGGQHGPTSAILGPSWGQLGANLTKLDQLGPTCANLGPTWGQLGTNLGPTWGPLGPTWGNMRPTWSQLGVHLGPSRANLDQLGPTRSQLRPARANMSQRGPTWGQLKPIMDAKIIEKPGFFDTSKKSLEALGDALGDLLESLGGALGTPWEPLGMPWRPYVDAGEGQTQGQARKGRPKAGPRWKWPPNKAFQGPDPGLAWPRRPTHVEPSAKTRIEITF